MAIVDVDYKFQREARNHTPTEMHLSARSSNDCLLGSLKEGVHMLIKCGASVE